MSEVVLEVQDLVTEFPLRQGVFTAVDGVSFALRRGQTLCVVGESGSGKSVTARSILQILDPPGRIAKGRILLHRHHTARGDAAREETIDLTALKPRSAAIRAIRGRDIAMIFQEPMSSLSLVHTIGNQLIEAIRLHMKMPRKAARARAIDLLRQVEIPDLERAIDSYPFEYSGGMRQRAMIAMALACNPTVLIADEPTTALDVTTQAEILDLIKSLQTRHGMAVMLITHDMGVVAETADEVVVMRHGKLIEQGPVADIFHQPQAPYTKRLLDAVLELDRPSERRLQLRQSRQLGPLILELSKLAKTFETKRGLPFFRRTNETRAVIDADLVLRRGENLGIVGESGSGKTTLGRCILRVVDPTSGRIDYQGGAGAVDVAQSGQRELAAVRREIRMIFQDPFASLNPRMNVGQIVGEPLLVQGLAKGEALRQRVAELLHVVGLDPSMMERYPHAFSGGQRQRIGIARAIALDPKVIVADEATSALDVSLRTQVLDLLLDLQERLDLSFLFISHDISVIRYFCDRVAVMYRGRIVEHGPTERVCDAPEHAYTRALLSAVPRPDPRARRMHERHRYLEPA